MILPFTEVRKQSKRIHIAWVVIYNQHDLTWSWILEMLSDYSSGHSYILIRTFIKRRAKEYFQG